MESRSYEKALLEMLKKVEDPEGFLHGVKYLDEHTREKSSDEVPLSDGRTLDRYSAPMTGADGKYIGRVWYFRDITDRKRIEEEVHRHRDDLEGLVGERTKGLARHRERLEELVSERTHDMGERVKELRCLYGASRLMSDPGVTTQGVLEGIVKLIPPSWQYPEITCASISYLGRQYKTERFKATQWRQGSEITVSGEPAGSVEVYYLEERQEAHEGPFLKEERDLVDALARELGRYAERKQADQDRERTLEELLQSQKMEAVGRLAGGIAHDFNNMMVAVKGQSELGMGKVKPGDPAYACFEKIRSASDSAVELTRKLSAFSRKQPHEFAECILNEVVAKLLELLPPLIGEDVAISTELEPALWTTMADRPNLTQVILNLAINARDAMEGGGSITIKTENVTIEKKRARRHVEARPGRFVLLSVTDTGRGMDKETVEHIFEPFYTTKELGKGTGLGLSVAYGILKSHNGWIEVESSRLEGSVFKVYLPVMEEVKGGVVKSAPAGRGERILLVEDEDIVRSTTKLVLVERGYNVVDAADSSAAVREFEKAKGDFQLVVSDVVLPDKSGIELVALLISRKPGLKVILMSGYLDDEAKMTKIREMGLMFIEKPYEVAELLKAVREAVGKRGD
jgi:signal transduction histidine kinase/ActR/RegA family two-component response regulator